MQRRTRRRTHQKKWRWPHWTLPAGIVVAALALVVCILLLRAPGYDFSPEAPVSYDDLRLNGNPAPQGELIAGERGPRNLYLSMPLEKVLKTLPVDADELQPEEYALLYGETLNQEGTPQPPCALMTVLQEQMQLRIATAPNAEGQYGWIVCDVNPDTGELTSVRWRTVEQMDVVGQF